MSTAARRDILGNARKMAGKTFAPEALQDGQIPVYRMSDGTWHAENKGTVGTGKNLMIMDGDKMLGEYNGDEMKASTSRSLVSPKPSPESTGYGIVSGCEPSINGMTVTVSAGVIHTADGRRIEVPEQSITLDAADATKPRTDVVYLDAAGKVQKKTGELSEANSTPAMPEMQESDRVLAVVAACDIKADNVTLLDRRSMKDEISYGQAIYKAGLKLRYTVGLSLHDMRNNVINDFPKKGYYVMRDDIDWVYVEQSKGVYTYDKYLKQLKAYKNAGVKGDCIFTFNNELYQLEGESNDCTYNAERAAAYKNFVLNFIKYMKEHGITGLNIEIINEANFPMDLQSKCNSS